MVYISSGNRRMKIPTFSLPAEKTCPNATELCKKFCYAKKAERCWKNVLHSRNNNALESSTKDFVYDMIKLIKKCKGKYFRIHESGDFYSQEYLNKWFDIIKQFPEKSFLAYTQMYYLDWSKKPKNLVIYWSVWADSIIEDVPEGNKAYCIDNGKGILPEYEYNKKGFICKKGSKSNVTCDKCLYCFKGKGDVVFHVH